MNYGNSNILVGDLGGTKTDLAIFSSLGEFRNPLAEGTFPSADFPNFAALVNVFLSQVNVKIERAVFGVAGPVIDRQASLTNLPWLVNEVELGKTLGLSAVHLINDLVATAASIPFLEPDQLFTLADGKPTARGVKAIIAPGTGLGEAYLTWDGEEYQTHPSEGGAC